MTDDLTISVARSLAKLNPRMTFIFVSGMGTNSKAAYMFRPALIVPLDGIKSKTRLYRVFYLGLRPILPLSYAAAPKYVTTTAQVGRAMLAVAKRGGPAPVLENVDINRISF